MLNQQPVERQENGDGRSLDFHSMFLTLQGEGPFAGFRAVFVRLAGCNLMCPGCDTEYTQGRKRLSVAAVLQDMHHLCPGHGTRGGLVVITGGEPLRQNIVPLCETLLNQGFTVQVETNGVFAAPDVGIWDRQMNFVVSPKTNRIHHSWDRAATAFKYVLQAGAVDPQDMLPLRALGHKTAPRVARPGPDYRGHIYVNPMDEKDMTANEQNLSLVAQAAIAHGYIAGVQMHKLMKLE